LNNGIKKSAQRALKEIGLSASGFCSESNPSPGTKISTPVFGCELFVAQSKHVTIHGGCNRKLFTAIHNLIWMSHPLWIIAPNKETA
jgi:hypothetical protein